MRPFDYGYHLLAVDVHHQHCLLVWLAACLDWLGGAMVRLVQEGDWDKLALKFLTKWLEGEILHTALVVERKAGSLA